MFRAIIGNEINTDLS